MIKFTRPRVGSDLATVVWYARPDRELAPDMVENTIRQARCRTELITGDQATEAQKADVVWYAFHTLINRGRIPNGADRDFIDLEGFNVEIRRQVFLRCRRMGLVRPAQ